MTTSTMRLKVRETVTHWTHAQRVFAAFAVLFTLTLIGCAAGELASAKLYRQQRNYVKADELLRQALQKEPTHDEAWTLYLQNLYDLKDYEKIAEVIDTAYLYAITHRPDVDIIRENTWIALYNGGLGAFQQNQESKEQQKAAIGLLESARKLAPERPETYDLLGSVYIAAGDTMKSVETYSEALKYLGPSHQQGVAMGLLLHMNPQAVERAIGAPPAKKQTVSIGGNDSSLIYVYPSKQAYLYFEKEAKPPYTWQLTGWRFTGSESEGLQPMRISTNAYLTLANRYYTHGLQMLAAGQPGAADELERAVPYLMTLQQIDPSDEFASSVIPEIYLKLNKTEKAKQQYEKLLAEKPTKTMYTNYGLLIMKSEDYPGAIAAFDKALGLDPNYESALYNEAASYKNWAATEQKAGKKDYKSKLEKSTEYFERLHNVNRQDYNSLVQLADNYAILDKKEKQASILVELEALKSSEPAASDPMFWESLGKLYAKANRSDESAKAYAKADQLKNKR